MKKTCICVAAACIGSLYAYNQLYSTTPSTWNYDNTMRQMCQDNNTIGTRTTKLLMDETVMTAIISGACTRMDASKTMTRIYSALTETCQGAYDKSQTLGKWLKEKSCSEAKYNSDIESLKTKAKSNSDIESLKTKANNIVRIPTCDIGFCFQINATMPECNGGFCNQDGATMPSCHGGKCDQSGAKQPKCEGGYCYQLNATMPECNGYSAESAHFCDCDQQGAKQPKCDCGHCDQQGTKQPECKGGYCDQRGAEQPTCDGGNCKN